MREIDADKFRLIVTKGVNLHVSVLELPTTVLGNEKAIETVIMNLLLNAAQATPAGGHVWGRVEGSAQRPGVRMVIDDTGPGIGEAARNRIFEPFFSGRDSTGLGLTVCRTIMERHGGHLWIDDTYELGTRFIAEFPRIG